MGSEAEPCWPAAVTLEQLSTFTADAAAAPTEPMFDALRETGAVAVIIGGRKAQATRGALEAADRFLTEASPADKAALRQKDGTAGGGVVNGRRLPRSGYLGVSKKGQGGGRDLLVKEVLDSCRVRAPASYERHDRMDVGGTVLRELDYAAELDRAFGCLQAVGHEALAAAGKALGLARTDLDPLLDATPLPFGA
jgi:hypothetical protein